MPSCSFQTVIASEKDKERDVTFHNLLEKDESLANKWLEELCRLLKKLQNVFACSEHCLKRLEDYLEISFLNSLIIQKPKTKEIMHRDVFGYLMKNSSFLHP